MNATNIGKGMIAGFVATLVLSAIMVLKAGAGLLPALNVIVMLSKVAGASTPVAGWVIHFLIGTVLWGGLFAWLDPQLPGGSHWLRGIVFAIGAWLLMMIVLMPVAGAGLFGAHLGIMAPVMTLVLHIIYGAVLGGVYGLERPQDAPQFEPSRR